MAAPTTRSSPGMSAHAIARRSPPAAFPVMVGRPCASPATVTRPVAPDPVAYRLIVLPRHGRPGALHVGQEPERPADGPREPARAVEVGRENRQVYDEPLPAHRCAPGVNRDCQLLSAALMRVFSSAYRDASRRASARSPATR